MYYIYETRHPEEPYMFQDQDRGIVEPAIFDTEEKANKMCEMMNAVAHVSTFKVAKCPKA